ncbi:MAG: hypothetical protein SFX74_12715 [Fimbriimonadaceae bacterium]|nr:hypothetical protein [Fimbriimonadaceae bacterium]
MIQLPAPLYAVYHSKWESLQSLPLAERFWAKDATLWANSDPVAVASMLGWVDVLPKMLARVAEITEFVEDVRSAGFDRVVLAGMGGSSLAPYVFAQAFGVQPGGLPLTVLDSTHPDTVRAVREIATDRTLFIVASKSGSTAEPTAFDRYFFEFAADPSRFVAITDPGSPFAQSAEARGFRKVFLNYAEIGGRYSALSFFGLVPAALLGHDVAALITAAMVYATDAEDAFRIGTALGVAAQHGRDKLTLLTAPETASFGLWLEQLVAESTGKQGVGIFPVAGEGPLASDAYGDDRLFATFGVPAPDAAPATITLSAIDSAPALVREFLRWEIATAVSGIVLGINPFDQPNVQESKDVTKAVLAQVDATGTLPAEPDLLAAEAIDLAAALSDVAPPAYLALQAYLHETPELNSALAELQAALAAHFRVATSCGYGPRFLHSTGQYHKGGPKHGVFLQLVDDPQTDDAIPGQSATWRQFVRAQAIGDAEALRTKGLRVIRISLGSDPAAAVRSLLSRVSPETSRTDS